jgi:hypothetical protein
MDESNLRLSRDGNFIPLTPKVFDELYELARHREQPLGKFVLVGTPARQRVGIEDQRRLK